MTRRAFRSSQPPADLPDEVVACVGGGSNAVGLFRAFYDDAGVRLSGVEAAGEGLERRHGASITAGEAGSLARCPKPGAAGRSGVDRPRPLDLRGS